MYINYLRSFLATIGSFQIIREAVNVISSSSITNLPIAEVPTPTEVISTTVVNSSILSQIGSSINFNTSSTNVVIYTLTGIGVGGTIYYFNAIIALPDFLTNVDVAVTNHRLFLGTLLRQFRGIRDVYRENETVYTQVISDVTRQTSMVENIVEEQQRQLTIAPPNDQQLIAHRSPRVDQLLNSLRAFRNAVQTERNSFFDVE